ncbi:MAG: hypothetical protein CFE35_16365 [Novosphingobium sp. PASSN1]|nr:MAG: hypothetical protein CFE35_16365 [Novosphingobium sp. PASSN1]
MTGRRLLGVKLTVDYNINGRVDATNNATGGTANSRRRNVSATYVLNAATSGEGFSVSGSNSQTHAVNNVAGLGTVRTLNQLNPLFSVTQTLTSNLSNFLTGTVTLSTDASALFSSLPAADVVYSAPSITGGQALLTLDYISDIPEPATWSLLLVGFGMVGFAARRRQAALAA